MELAMLSSAAQRVILLVQNSLARNSQAMRVAIIIVVLIGALIWRTQWPSLQPGLWILLGGQIGVVLLRLRRIPEQKKVITSLRAEALDERSLLDWFRTERQFIKNLGLFENGGRSLGFLSLAYGFWTSTRQLWLSLALGLVYPLVAYAGMARRTEMAQLRRLEAQRHEAEIDLLTHSERQS
jgi:hypothetical protein